MTDRRQAVNSCRHMKRRGIKPVCAAGRNIEVWVARCGNPQGWMLMIPCCANAPDKPLFNCPELDRKTDEEIGAERTAMSQRMDRLVKALPELQKMKRKMIANKLTSAVATCPWCGEKDALSVSVAIGYNNHMGAFCNTCKEGFRE